MTLKTSLFNRGIYKATVRRYIWGSVFYAITIFMVTSMIILFNIDPDISTYTMDLRGAFILNDGMLIVPLLMAIAAPTIVALMAYRFVHAKKTSVFVHSLPVSRGANYVSTIAAAFTLLGLPIVLNGLILMSLSLFGYGAFFDIPSCLIWTGLNLLTVFLMFSIATLSAFLTGNSFAMVVINALLHSIGLIIMASVSFLAYMFMYGYYETNALINFATEWNFIAYIMGQVNRVAYNGNFKLPFGWIQFIIMLALAIACYVAAYLLYRKRRIETAEDVAPYKCLNPIYKYLITFLAALGAFAIAGSALEQGSYIVAFVVPIVSAIVYFGTEMILKKSLRIWKSYKGYFAFLAAFTVFILAFAYTGMFGFETRVPEADTVKKVMMHESYARNNYAGVEERDVIDYVLSVHKELVARENIYVYQTQPTDKNEFLYLRYELKDGKTIVRRYPVTEEMLCRVMDNLYQSEEYKRKNLEMFSDTIGKMYIVDLFRDGESRISDEAKVAEFVECLRADLMELEYTQVYARRGASWNMNVGIEYVRADEENLEQERRGFYSAHQNINANFRNTVNWIKNNGYEQKLFNTENYDLAILTADEWRKISGKEKEVKLAMASGKMEATVEAVEAPRASDIPGLVRISEQAEKNAIRDFVITTPERYVPGKEKAHYIIGITGEGYLTELAGFYDEADIEKFIK